MSKFWQYDAPLACPAKHTMGWLGGVFWLCPYCKTIYVQVAREAPPK